jgi:hypothetical protein
MSNIYSSTYSDSLGRFSSRKRLILWTIWDKFSILWCGVHSYICKLPKINCTIPTILKLSKWLTKFIRCGVKYVACAFNINRYSGKKCYELVAKYLLRIRIYSKYICKMYQQRGRKTWKKTIISRHEVAGGIKFEFCSIRYHIPIK